VKGDTLYAIVMGKAAGTEIAINSLPQGGPAGSVRSVAILGGEPLKYKQTATGLNVTLPQTSEPDGAFVLKIAGLKTNPDIDTDSGNPDCACAQH